jgi:putative DNA primase/helicase
VNAAEFAQRVPKAHRSEHGAWSGCCLAHDDRSPSLSWRDGNTCVLVRCHAGCPFEKIVAAFNVRPGQLRYDSNGDGQARDRDATTSARIAAAIYDYTDARGALLYQEVRYEPKDFRLRRPDGAGGWIWNLNGLPAALYRLPELAEARRVYVPEGPKDCDTLAALGLTATTNHGGAGKWREEHTAALGAAAVPEVVVLRDNDRAGEAHAVSVASALVAAGLRVKRLTLPGPLRDKHGEDVSDWVAVGHTATELEALADAAPILAPNAADGPVLVNLGDVEPEAVDWLWPQRIARGKIAEVIGEPGAGKTQLTLDMAARVTRGLPWPDGGEAPAGAVLILTSEDGLADTVRPIVDRQGGDARQVYVLRAVRIAGQECPFNLERDLPALEQAIQRTKAALVIISPLSAYLGAKDSYKDADVRAILTPLAALAEQYRVAIVGILHLTKAATRRLLLRAQGSVAFVGQARTVLVVGDDPETPGRPLLASSKNNLGPEAPALAFRISDAGLTWEPHPVEGTAERLLAVDEPTSRSDRRERDDASTFLRTLLAEGPVASKQVEADAKANGIAQRTLWRAKTDLDIVADRVRTTDGRTAGWYWRLPVLP